MLKHNAGKWVGQGAKAVNGVGQGDEMWWGNVD